MRPEDFLDAKERARRWLTLENGKMISVHAGDLKQVAQALLEESEDAEKYAKLASKRLQDIVDMTDRVLMAVNHECDP